MQATVLAFPTRWRAKPIDFMIWLGDTPYSLEIVQAFLVEAEKLRRTHQRALYAVLVAARNKEWFEHTEFPSGHPWPISLADGAIALAFVPVFYRGRIPLTTQPGEVIQIKDSIDELRCDSEGHREILREIFFGQA